MNWSYTYDVNIYERFFYSTISFKKIIEHSDFIIHSGKWMPLLSYSAEDFVQKKNLRCEVAAEKSDSEAALALLHLALHFQLPAENGLHSIAVFVRSKNYVKNVRRADSDSKAADTPLSLTPRYWITVNR
jgi:hypothetical protein